METTSQYETRHQWRWILPSTIPFFALHRQLDMSHHHHHHHGHSHGASDSSGGGDFRLIVSIVLNAIITVAEIIGGIISGSLALISDALHNLSDTTSLGVAFGARRIAARDPNQRKTFGYRRAEIIGAFVNLITLVLIALYLVKEAVERFFDPQPIDGGVMLAVAIVGLLANVASAALLFRDARSSLNMRSAFLHILSDGISSVGVVFGGVMIMLYDVYWIDPVLTLAISAYLLIHSYHMLRETVDILMESTPRGVDVDGVTADVQSVKGVQDMHHLHIWQLDEVQRALEAHVVIDEDDMMRMEEIKSAIKELLRRRHQIGHSTLEFEFAPCESNRHHTCYENPATSAA